MTILAVVVALGVLGFAPAHDEAAAPDRLRVMTWNVLGSAAPDPDALAAEIVRRRVDVAGLQEIEQDQTRDLEASLRQHDPRWRAVWHATGHDPGGGLPFTRPPEGHALFSRYPMTSARSRPLPQRDFHPRILQSAVVTVGGVELFVFNTHLCRTPPFDFVDRACWTRDQAGRVDQVRALLRVMRVDGPAILLGDLNARPGSPPVELLARSMRDALERGPETRIDYVFVRGLRVESASRPPAGLSDHRPVVAELSLGSISGNH